MLVVGLDACERSLALRLAREGAMPVLAALLERGAHGRIENSPGLFGGSVWPSFSTGVGPGTHGRYCFSQFDPGTYKLRTTSAAHDIKGVPYWERLSEAGRRVAVFDVPHTAPCAGLNGVQVVDWAAHDGKVGFATEPAELAAELRARYGEHPVPGNCNDERTDGGDFTRLVDGLLDGIAMRSRMACEFLGRGSWDVFTYVFSEAHCVGHQCWHLHDDKHRRHVAGTVGEVGGDPVLRVYQALDTALGQVVDAAGPDATTVVVLSHGMGPFYGGNHLLDEVLRRVDVAELPSARRLGVRACDAAFAALPRRARRSVLWRMGLPPSPRALTEAGIRPRLVRNRAVNRRFYAVPNNDSCGAIRFNVVGREPDGLLTPSELPRWFETVRSELLALRNLTTGEKVVRRVLEVGAIFDGPEVGNLPDLLVEWNSARPIEHVASAAIGELTVADDALRSGDHRPDGHLIVAGPAIAPGHVDAVSCMDVAPTICALVGVHLPGATGRPLPQVQVVSSRRSM